MWMNLLVTILRNIATQISSEIISVAIKKLEARIDKKKVGKNV